MNSKLEKFANSKFMRTLQVEAKNFPEALLLERLARVWEERWD